MKRVKEFEREESDETFGEFLSLYRKTFEGFLGEISQLKNKIIENELEIRKSRLKMKEVTLNKPLSITPSR